MGELPFTSIIIPCRNEKEFISGCLDSIIANDFPKERLEVLVVDGMSEDGTQAVIENYSKKYLWIRLIKNPEKITPIALNKGILDSKGEIIIWMSAHNRYEKDYISRSVESLNKYGADNVGGIMTTLPRIDNFTGRAIVASLSHRFGVGNSYFRVQTNEPKWVDTVFGGCYRRGVFKSTCSQSSCRVIRASLGPRNLVLTDHQCATNNTWKKKSDVAALKGF
jgi:glycosyltransferase involved in cell wall biosynthesis